MSLSYDLFTLVPDSRRITYWGDFCSSDDMELCYKGSEEGDSVIFRIGDTEMRIFLMVPQAGTFYVEWTCGYLVERDHE